MIVRVSQSRGRRNEQRPTQGIPIAIGTLAGTRRIKKYIILVLLFPKDLQTNSQLR